MRKQTFINIAPQVGIELLLGTWSLGPTKDLLLFQSAQVVIVKVELGQADGDQWFPTWRTFWGDEGGQFVFTNVLAVEECGTQQQKSEVALIDGLLNFRMPLFVNIDVSVLP